MTRSRAVRSCHTTCCTTSHRTCNVAATRAEDKLKTIRKSNALVKIATWLLSSSSCKCNRQVATFFSVSLALPLNHPPVANTRRDPCTSHTSRITHMTMLM